MIHCKDLYIINNIHGSISQYLNTYALKHSANVSVSWLVSSLFPSCFLVVFIQKRKQRGNKGCLLICVLTLRWAPPALKCLSSPLPLFISWNRPNMENDISIVIFDWPSFRTCFLAVSNFIRNSSQDWGCLRWKAWNKGVNKVYESMGNLFISCR